jgi:hypothetical protein
VNPRCRYCSRQRLGTPTLTLHMIIGFIHRYGRYRSWFTGKPVNSRVHTWLPKFILSFFSIDPLAPDAQRSPNPPVITRTPSSFTNTCVYLPVFFLFSNTFYHLGVYALSHCHPSSATHNPEGTFCYCSHSTTPLILIPGIISDVTITAAATTTTTISPSLWSHVASVGFSSNDNLSPS